MGRGARRDDVLDGGKERDRERERERLKERDRDRAREREREMDRDRDILSLQPLPRDPQRERELQPRDRDRERRDREKEKERERAEDMSIIRLAASERRRSQMRIEAAGYGPLAPGADAVTTKMRLAEATGVGVFAGGIGGLGRGGLGVRDGEREREVLRERERDRQREAARDVEAAEMQQAEMFVPPHPRPPLPPPPHHNSHSHSHSSHGLPQAHGPPLALSHLNPNANSNPNNSNPNNNNNNNSNNSSANQRDQQSAQSQQQQLQRESIYDRTQPQFQFQTQFQVQPITPNAPGVLPTSRIPSPLSVSLSQEMVERERERGRYAYRDLPIPYGPDLNGGPNVPRALGNPSANTLLGLGSSLEKYYNSSGGMRPEKPIFLGTFVYPHTPFPYLFSAACSPPALVSSEKRASSSENKENAKGKEKIVFELTRDRETRAVILIPSGHLPVSKPLRPRIWGGGISIYEQNPPAAHYQPMRARRVYTDDSDLFLCAVHSGFVRWSAVRKARREGKDMRIEIGVWRIGGRGLGGAVGVGRFVGGPGERYWCGEGDGLGVNEGREDDDDGRTLTSAGWGSEHDGSGIEVLSAQFVAVRPWAHFKSGVF